jgi:hypothetical protein
MRYVVHISRSLTTAVEVEADSAEDAVTMVDRRDFPLPADDAWQVVKRSYDYRVTDQAGNGLEDSGERHDCTPARPPSRSPSRPPYTSAALSWRNRPAHSPTSRWNSSTTASPVIHPGRHRDNRRRSPRHQNDAPKAHSENAMN